MSSKGGAGRQVSFACLLIIYQAWSRKLHVPRPHLCSPAAATDAVTLVAIAETSTAANGVVAGGEVEGEQTRARSLRLTGSAPITPTGLTLLR